jgi:RimJ/RimL family protein N-acetyltransferase
MSDPLVAAYLQEGLLDEAQTTEFVNVQLGAEAEAFAVVLRSEERVIGHMLFHWWYAPHTYEIGWVLARRYHGQGYASEAALALLRYGFEALRLHRIIATCQPENIASWRVMEKIGLRREGHFRKGIHRPEGTWWDEYFYALLDEEWLRRPEAEPAEGR